LPSLVGPIAAATRAGAGAQPATAEQPEAAAGQARARRSPGLPRRPSGRPSRAADVVPPHRSTSRHRRCRCACRRTHGQVAASHLRPSRRYPRERADPLVLSATPPPPASTTAVGTAVSLNLLCFGSRGGLHAAIRRKGGS
jgi:hypothetical protein